MATAIRQFCRRGWATQGWDFRFRVKFALRHYSEIPLPVTDCWRRAVRYLMLIQWSLSDDTRYATVLSADGVVRYHLIVEQLPSHDSWDWTVWRRHRPEWSARHGTSDSAAVAMLAAKTAADWWENEGSVGIEPADGA